MPWLNVAETSNKYADLDRDEKAETGYFTCVNHTSNTRDETHVKVTIVTDETRSNKESAEETHVVHRQVNNRQAKEHDLNDTRVRSTQAFHRVNSISVTN